VLNKNELSPAVEDETIVSDNSNDNPHIEQRGDRVGRQATP
jgi:hypothetical protein